MAFNAASQAHSGIDVISDGAITQFYDLMEDAMRISEVMPGRYNTITSPSYGNACPINESAFTTIDLSAGSPDVLSIDNSYITANIVVPITIDKAQLNATDSNKNPQTYFVGYKSSLDAIAKYQIMHNGQLFYDQPYCGEESYIVQQVIPDHVKNTRPQQYSSHENAWQRDSNVCGTYVTFVGTGASKTLKVNIPIKIDISQFIMFSNFKYLPGFFGTWSIKMWFTSRTLVVCPVDTLVTSGAARPDGIEKRFTQIGFTFKGYQGNAANQNISAQDVKLTANGCTTSNVLLNAAKFTLNFGVYDGLKARYLQSPLAIPCSVLLYGRFAGAMHKSNGFSSTYNTAINCCEATFLIPFVNDDLHTVCRNPKWKGAFLNISQYGNFPQQYVDTYPDGTWAGDGSNGIDLGAYLRFQTMTLDALNINNSSIMSMTKELSASLSANYCTQTIVKTDSETTSLCENDRNNPDDTNFVFAIPFAESDDFQGGLTCGQAQMKFQVAGANTPMPSELENSDIGIGVTAMFLCDRAILIKTVDYSEQPVVKMIEEKLHPA